MTNMALFQEPRKESKFEIGRKIINSVLDTEFEIPIFMGLREWLSSVCHAGVKRVQLSSTLHKCQAGMVVHL